MLLFALMHCTDASGTPDRRADVLTLLSAPNRCQIETCSVLLASHGNTYTEALLWLYRSQGQHTRVLQALTEDKCVALGAWTREQFYGWTADYLRWLWYQEEDATLPRQALLALKPVLEYDSEVRALPAAVVNSARLLSSWFSAFVVFPSAQETRFELIGRASADVP